MDKTIYEEMLTRGFGFLSRGLPAAVLSLGAAGTAAAQAHGARDVILATTTSLNDSGLLDSLAPLFERATGYHLRVIAVGSGGPYAQAAARALLEHTDMAPRAIAEAAMRIAADLCIYTNQELQYEELASAT